MNILVNYSLKLLILIKIFILIEFQNNLYIIRISKYINIIDN